MRVLLESNSFILNKKSRPDIQVLLNVWTALFDFTHRHLNQTYTFGDGISY